MIDLLTKLEDYMRSRADSADEEGVVPNEEMRLLTEIEEAIEGVTASKLQADIEGKIDSAIDRNNAKIVDSLSEYKGQNEILTNALNMALEKNQVLQERNLKAECAMRVLQGLLSNSNNAGETDAAQILTVRAAWTYADIWFIEMQRRNHYKDY